jgi:hypothetical protein
MTSSCPFCGDDYSARGFVSGCADSPTRGFVAEEIKRSCRDGVVALRSPSEDAEVKSKNRCAFGSQPHLVLLSWPTVRNVVCGVDNNIRQNQS